MEGVMLTCIHMCDGVTSGLLMCTQDGAVASDMLLAR
jgi:hypothetical protein